MAIQLVKRALPFMLALTVGVLLARLTHFNAGHADDLTGRASATQSVSHEKTWLIIQSQPGWSYLIDGSHKKGLEGTARLSLTLDASGSVSHVDIVSSSESKLNEDAIKAVKSIRFTPATVDGRPISLRATADYRCSVFWFGHRESYRCGAGLLELENDWRVIYAGSL